MALTLLAQKQTPPPPGAPRPFEFPKTQKKVLANGLTVYAVEDHRLPLVTYDLAVMAGSSLDAPQKAGLAFMVATLLREGTKTRKSNDISKLVDDAGGGLGASTVDDYSSVTSSFMKQYADLGLELLADITVNPTFPQEEIDRQMQQAQSSLQVAYVTAETLAALAAGRALLGTHPYALPTQGTPATLKNLKREDMVAFHQRYYVPGGSVLVIAGDIPPEEGFAKAEKYLGSWKGAPVTGAPLPKPNPGKPGILLIDLPNAVQTQIRVGEASIPRNDPDYIALQAANQVFGGSFNSRLNIKVRANEGLTYNANSSLNSERQAGLFTVSTFTRNEKTAEVIQFILDLYKDWKANPATEQEFKETQDFLIGSFGLSVETAEAVAGRVLGAAINGLGDDYWPNFRSKLLALKREDIAAAVEKHIDLTKLQIVCVGKASDIAKPLEKFGVVTVIKADDFDPVAPDLRKPKPAADASPEGVAAARKLIDRAVAAAGGLEALEKVKDISSRGTMTFLQPMKMDAASEEDIVYPARYRTSMKMAMGEMIQASDGEKAWFKQGAQIQDLPPMLIAEIKKQVQVIGAVGLLREAAAGHATLAMLPDAGVSWKLEGQEVKIYFDPQTGLPARIVQAVLGPRGRVEQETDLADWRDAGGIKLPYAETILSNGAKAAERKWTERKVNTNPSPDLFKKPAQ